MQKNHMTLEPTSAQLRVGHASISQYSQDDTASNQFDAVK